jgi:MoxR-like ATPase
MSEKTRSIGDKKVYVRQPYEAPVGKLVGRDEELKLLTAAWMAGKDCAPLAPLLLGEPGVGKNRLVYELAQRTHKPLFIFQGHEDVTAEDLACAVRFRDDADGGMDYVASDLVTAMLDGGICFIDEIAKIRPRALALLVSVLDDRRYIDSNLLGARVYAHKAFRFVAATNTADLEGNALPEFIRSRMRPVIRMGPPSPEEIARIVGDRYPRLELQAGPLIQQFWLLWGERKPAPTPRDAIYVFDLALSLADYEACCDRRGLEVDAERIAVAPPIEPRHLEQAFAEVLGSGAQMQ